MREKKSTNASDDMDIFINIRASRSQRDDLAEIARKKGMNSSEQVRKWIRNNRIK